MSLKLNLHKTTAMSILFLALPTAGLNAVAQDNTAPMTIDEVVVTGSYIKRSGYDGKSPIQVFDKEKLSAMGAQNMIDVANNLTINSGSRFTNETGSLTGTSQFNIRGLGTGSTLTLINGRRGGIATVADAFGNQFFDVNQLPLAMIERIDFQTDGASATYGSQAVAGVANIITRKGFEGLELSGRYQDASNSSFEINLASGLKTDRASLNLYATVYNQTQNFRTDFDWLVERIHGNGDLTQSKLISSTGSPGTYKRAITDINGVINASGTALTDPDCEAAGGILKGSTCRHSFADQVSIIPDETRYQAFSEFEYDITEDVTFFSEVSFSHNEVARVSSSPLFRNGLVSNLNIYIPADHPFNFFKANDAGTGLIYVDPANWDPDTDVAVDLACQCRPFGDDTNGDSPSGLPNQNHYTLDYYRGALGVDWDINDDWNLSTSYVYALSTRNFLSDIGSNALALNTAILEGRFNPFGTSKANPTLISPKDGVSVAGNTIEDYEDFTHKSRSFTRTEQQVAEAVISGTIAEMEAGPVGVALGGQYRHEEYKYEPDSLVAKGLANSRDGDSAQAGTTNVYAAFAETIVPVTDTLEIQAAVRHESYGGTVGATTDPKIAARWQATDAIAFRASFGTAFQAPSTLQTGEANGVAFLDDPVSLIGGSLVCTDTGVTNNVAIRTSGSDSLKPTSANSVNVGVVVEPLDGMSISVDVWNFNYSDLIAQDANAQTLVSDECAGVSAGGTPNFDSRVTRTAEGNVRQVQLSFINTGSVKTNGLDFNLNYGIDTGNTGHLTFGVAASYVNKFDVETVDGAEIIRGAGNFNNRNAFKAMPKWRSNFRLGWVLDKHSANVSVRHISSYNNDQTSGDLEDRVGAYTAVDLKYSFLYEYENGSATEFSIGANNVFDLDPPTLGEGNRPGYDSTTHDVRGRVLYVSAKQVF
tara:strand:- start:1065 stop:3863 length:2799 start_codon:yes stop_codon:yes gene_type:complete